MGFRGQTGVLLAVLLGVVLAGSLAGFPALAACRSTVVDQLSLRRISGHPSITVTVNGEPVSMLLDTGAEASTVTPALAARLGLAVVSGAQGSVTGVDGRVGTPLAVATASVAITSRGTAAGVQRPLLVLDLPAAEAAGLGGVAGVDILSGFELDLDQEGGLLLLRRPEPSCTNADPPPWPATRLVTEFTRRGRIGVQVRFGAATVPALLDTGVDRALMSRGAAERAGVTAVQLGNAGATQVMGAAQRPLTIRTVRLAGTVAGDAQPAGLDVGVLDGELPGVEMLLGDDYVARRRVLISWTRRAVWVGTARR